VELTDQQRLLALLKDFGITPAQGVRSVRLDALEGGVKGHPYFYCHFAFDADGKFKDVGVWE
jgi:hypothetical protein